MSHLLAFALVLTATSAIAQPIVAPERTRPQEATDVGLTPRAGSDAPAVRPDQASGISIDDEATASEGARTIPRALLFVPRVVVWAAAQPIRGAIYLYERHDESDRFHDHTSSEGGRFGGYPIAGYDSGFGFKVGARVLYKDIFGDGESIKLRGDYGGEFRYAVGVGATTGRRFGRVELDADSSIERRPRDHFYGIGNGKEIVTPLETPIDPSRSDVAISSRFRQDVVRNVVGIKVGLTERLHTRLAGAWIIRELGGADDQDIATRYDTSKLIGWNMGLDNIYVENELVYDSRRPANEYTAQTIDGTGWLLRAHGGIGRGLDEDPTRYVRYGGEVERCFDIYAGNRTLALRLRLDSVAGTDGRTDGRIAFVDLPHLGGPEVLRGYPSGRFRDRAVAVGTAEYTWALLGNASAYAFFDIGEPLDRFDAALSGSGTLRFGYGVGIQLHTRERFFMRSQLAASREGDLMLNLLFSPTFGRRERARRY